MVFSQCNASESHNTRLRPTPSFSKFLHDYFDFSTPRVSTAVGNSCKPFSSNIVWQDKSKTIVQFIIPSPVSSCIIPYSDKLYIKDGCSPCDATPWLVRSFYEAFRWACWLSPWCDDCETVPYCMDFNPFVLFLYQPWTLKISLLSVSLICVFNLFHLFIWIWFLVYGAQKLTLNVYFSFCAYKIN